MTLPDEEHELSAADRLISDVLHQALSVEIETRLRHKLAAVHAWVDCQTTTPAVGSRWMTPGKILAVVMAASILMACGLIWPMMQMAGIPGSVVQTPGPPMKVQPAPPNLQLVRPTPDSAVVTVDLDDDEYGTLTGVVALEGPPPPQRKPLMTAQLKDLARYPQCGPTIPDESLMVDSSSQGVANVFVYLVKPLKIHPSLSTSRPITFNATCGRFVPRAMVVRTGQAIHVRTPDPFVYNLHAYPLANVQQNLIFGTSPISISMTTAERLPFKVGDDIHPWMESYWLVLDHPYAAITDSRGRFTIPKVPVGPCEFRVWHERVGWLLKNEKTNITPGRPTELPKMLVSADKFRS